MVELDKEEAIRHFIASNGLDEDLLDEKSDAEVYQQTGELIADYFRNIESRIVSIEYRLRQLEGNREGGCGEVR